MAAHRASPLTEALCVRESGYSGLCDEAGISKDCEKRNFRAMNIVKPALAAI